MKLNPSIKNMSNEYIFFTDQTALTFRICLVTSDGKVKRTLTLRDGEQKSSASCTELGRLVLRLILS